MVGEKRVDRARAELVDDSARALRVMPFKLVDERGELCLELLASVIWHETNPVRLPNRVFEEKDRSFGPIRW